MQVKRGDLVRIKDTASPDDGRTGIIVEIMRANGNYERRARVRVSSAYQPTIATRFLEPME